jgi:hypothetical protein
MPGKQSFKISQKGISATGPFCLRLDSYFQQFRLEPENTGTTPACNFSPVIFIDQGY